MSENMKSAAREPALPTDTLEGTIEHLTTMAQQRMATVSYQLNNRALLEAMQEGYRQACKDHGLPAPHFAEPPKGWVI